MKTKINLNNASEWDKPKRSPRPDNSVFDLSLPSSRPREVAVMTEAQIERLIERITTEVADRIMKRLG